MNSKTPSTTIVIFGGSGDLANRKLIPALFSLSQKERLPINCNIVGFSSSKLDTEEYRRLMRVSIDEFFKESFSEEQWETFVKRLHFISGSFTEGTDYAVLEQTLKNVEGGSAHRLYYLATPPRFFAEIVAQLGQAGMVQEEPPEKEGDKESWRRVIIEKPFGRDLATARALNKTIHADLAEHQIYRIDHYLAKETVQNILYFRFGNTMFEPLWNRNYIDNVQITVGDVVDVGSRAGDYDQAGVLRDMFQNHLMQLMSLVSMEPPSSFSADAVRNEKVKVLSAIRPMSLAGISKNSVRAQYNGYHEAPDVAKNSQTATYAAMRLFIDNKRWQDVPFYLRSGKGLAQKATEIIIQFKKPPYSMFDLPPKQKLQENYLALCLQPHEGIHQRFGVKVPDTAAEIDAVDMTFHYDEAFGKCAIPEAYERLLLNALEGDATLFTRSDGIEAAWKTIDSILQVWDTSAAPSLDNYEMGSWGPQSADELLAQYRHKWRYSCAKHD
jgi:glucose-6-phosphate 1-dehydrogenase